MMNLKTMMTAGAAALMLATIQTPAQAAGGPGNEKYTRQEWRHNGLPCAMPGADIHCRIERKHRDFVRRDRHRHLPGIPFLFEDQFPFDRDYGYGYGYRYDYVDVLSCGEARQEVRARGFKKISTKDCVGSSYTFTASKNGKRYLVRVNAVTGRVKSSVL